MSRHPFLFLTCTIKKVNVAASGYNMELLKAAIRLLEANGMLPQEYRPHKLPWQLCRHLKCHIKGDWLMVWQQNDTEFTLLFTGAGTHSDLF